jgi:hypothetical protein
MGGWLRGSWLGQLGRALAAVWIGWAGGSAVWPRAIATAAPESFSPSPLPIPWEWVYDLQEKAQERQCTLVGLLRSQPLVAPDSHWQVYTRLNWVVTPSGGQLTSVLFAENTRSRALQVLYQTSVARG